MTFQHLISGFDTIECAYYLVPTDSYNLDFDFLRITKEASKELKSRRATPIKLGCEEFLLASYGTKSGYPFLLDNDVFNIQLGEFNQPNFIVKFRSVALWHFGADNLHKRFLQWAKSVGLMQAQPERLSRTDFAFDYYLPKIDFSEDHFVSLSSKDNKYRNNGEVQTFRFGVGSSSLKIYNKVDEINEKSHKTWLFKLWGIDHDVWRVEWQVRKEQLRKIGIITFEDLNERQGDLLRHLVKHHTTLRIKSQDSNRSRWEMHPLWIDLIHQVNSMQGLGVVRELKKHELLDETLTRIGMSVYGYLKRVAAIDVLNTGDDKAYLDEAYQLLQKIIDEIHDPLTWQQDVMRRVNEMRLSEW